MFRTVLLLGDRAALRKLSPEVKMRMRAAARQIAKMQQRKKESEAERLFMVKIAEGRRRRKRIIAAALHRVLSKKKKEEAQLLQRYEANKAKATEELKKMEKAAASAAVKVATVPKPEKVVSVKKKEHLKRDDTLRTKKEEEAEKNFFETITKLRDKREKELLASREAEKELGDANDEGKLAADEGQEATVVGTEALAADEKLVATTVNEQHASKGRARRKITPEDAEQADAAVVEATEDRKMPSTETDEALTVSDETSRGVRQASRKTAKMVVAARTRTRREKPRGKGQTTAQPQSTQKEMTTTAVGTAPLSVDLPQQGAALSPAHAVALTSFNEPPLISPVKATVDVGSRRLPALSSVEAPVVPLRPGPLDAFPNMTRVVHTTPAPFSNDISLTRPSVEGGGVSTGLFRL